MCVVFVKFSLTFFQFLVRVDLVTERENDAQVLSINLSKSILKNGQAVDVCSIWSRGLFENETGQADLSLGIGITLRPFVDFCSPFGCRHVWVVKSGCIDKVEVVEGEHSEFLRAPSSLHLSLERLWL